MAKKPVAYMIIHNDGTRIRWWGYGYHAKWEDDVMNARLYDRRQNANNARIAIMKKRRDLKADDVKVEGIFE